MSEAAQPSPRRITLPHLALLLPWVLSVIAAFGAVTDNSFLWHITAGHLQADRAAVLTSDPFSFTVAGEPWLTQSWLAELLYGLGHDLTHLGFVGPLIMVLSLITMFGIGLIAFRKSASLPATVVVLLLSTVLIAPFLVPRPVLFSFPLFVLVILAWDRPATRWAVPFLMWLWASTHGSFAIGLVYLGLVVVSKKEWKSLPQFVVTGLAALLTAHGLGVLQMLLDFIAAKPYLDLLSEWRTPEFLTPALLPFVAGILILILGGIRQRIEASALWVIGPFLVLGMTATRAVPTAWIALIPLFATSLGGLSWRWGRGFPRPIAVVLSVAVLVLPFLLTSPVAIDSERLPVLAAEALAQVPTFHDDDTGGYLIYANALDHGVFIDDRAELYGERLEEYVDVREGRRPWQDVFERDGIEQALLRAGEALGDDLQSAGWEITYGDDFFVILRPPSS